MTTATDSGNQGANGNGRAVGELAEAAGLTVRTLHYYEEIELLVPSGRTAAGHRRYSPDDVNRLYRICFLRRLGLPLTDIGAALDTADWDVSGLLQRHLAGLEERLAAGARLRGHLHQLVSVADTAGQPTPNDLLQVLEDMTMLETNVTKRISMLVYADIAAAATHLTDVFGLGPAEITRGEDGTIHLATVQAGDGEIWLHPESPKFQLASPRTLGAATSTMAIIVDDVDEHYRMAAAAGAEIVYEPVDQPYGYREYGARDNEGGLWSFMKPS